MRSMYEVTPPESAAPYPATSEAGVKIMPRYVTGLLATLFFFAASPASAQTRVVTGKVTDSLSGQIVTSGQVSVVGSTAGTTTQEDGTFPPSGPAPDVPLS